MDPKVPGPGPRLLAAQGIPQAIAISNDALALVDRLTTLAATAQDIASALWRIQGELAALGVEGRSRGDGPTRSD